MLSLSPGLPSLLSCILGLPGLQGDSPGLRYGPYVGGCSSNIIVVGFFVDRCEKICACSGTYHCRADGAAWPDRACSCWKGSVVMVWWFSSSWFLSLELYLLVKQVFACDCWFCSHAQCLEVLPAPETLWRAGESYEHYRNPLELSGNLGLFFLFIFLNFYSKVQCAILAHAFQQPSQTLPSSILELRGPVHSLPGWYPSLGTDLQASLQAGHPCRHWYGSL